VNHKVNLQKRMIQQIYDIEAELIKSLIESREDVVFI
jgi:hypothetical protein